MNKKIYALILVIILLSLVLSACTRSATGKSPTDSTPTSEIPFPVGTLDTSARVTEIVQQTRNASISTPNVPTAQLPQVSTPVIAPTTAGLPTVALQPTATKPPVVLPTLSRPATYTIQSGEWPICIARRYNLDLNSLLEANNLNMNSSPDPGTVLIIPSTGTWSSGDRALKAHPVDFVVSSGDTINSIACEFGDVDPLAIAAANSIASPYTLTVGSTIRIP
ncbi:MAG TPA: LysM peptidoglycan-binding domain-containing protein [Bellilinea sp.]